jgi:hypothetical protein
VPAYEPARVLLVPQDLLPHLAGEGVDVHLQHGFRAVDVDHNAFVDEVAAAFPVGSDEGHRVQHAALGAGGFQLHRIQQREQNRPMRAVVPFQQRQVVVAVVRRHRLVRGGQHVQATGLGQRFEYPPPGALRDDLHRLHLGYAAFQVLGVRLGRLDSFADHRQHIAKHAQQALGFRPVRLLQLLQLLAGLLVDNRHALAEHGHHVIPRRRAADVDQAGDQRQPLVIADLAQIRQIGHPRFTSEMGDLARRNTLQPHLGAAQVVEFLQVREPGLELAQCRGPRWILEPVEPAAPRGRVHHQQPLLQTGPIGQAQPVGDHREKPGVDLGTDRRGHRIQRAVAR